jgi:hypothetical protein
MIDDHAHPFSLEFAPLNLREFALDTRPGPEAVERRAQLGPGRLYQHLLERRLGQLLGVDAPDAVRARDAEASGDWSGWVRRLLDDAEVRGMIFDAATGCHAPIAPAEHAALVGRPIWHMARIDPTIDTMIGHRASAQEIVRAVETYVSDSVANGCVALKTILAYRTGLAVDPTADLAAAQRSLEDDSVPTKRRGKALRDLILRTVLARCADLNVPIQIHTGIGDSDLRLRDSDPLHLEDLLDTPEGTAATVVLIHGSFPWGRQAAYLSSVRPNVWVELSLSNLFAPLTVADELAAIIDVAPRGRIVVGTDGHVVPESHWFGGRMLAEAWRSVADRLMAVGADARWIHDTRSAVMDANARQLYGLTEPS